jgi:hypothetical protein
MMYRTVFWNGCLDEGRRMHHSVARSATQPGIHGDAQRRGEQLQNARAWRRAQAADRKTRGNLHQRLHQPPTEPAKNASELDFVGGRYWDRTSDPCRVKAVLYR